MGFVPAYLKVRAETFEESAEWLERVLADCTLCPRQCHVKRNAGEQGYCRTGQLPFVSSWGPHRGEERPLVGRGGSGTIFFSNCNLGCLYCQNYTISHLGEGAEISHERLADIMLSLQEAGCHNINLVTPTHQVPGIVRSVKIASDKGLSLPLVYNCGGYESLAAIALLDGIIDIYMPDFKYADPAAAERYSDAVDYPERAREAIREMHRQVGDLVMDERGIATRGLLVRHLVLPEGLAGTEEVVEFIAAEISPHTYLNVMDQYHPCDRACEHPFLNRRIGVREYEDALACARRAGMTRIDGVTI